MPPYPLNFLCSSGGETPAAAITVSPQSALREEGSQSTAVCGVTYDGQPHDNPDPELYRQGYRYEGDGCPCGRAGVCCLTHSDPEFCHNH